VSVISVIILTSLYNLCQSVALSNQLTFFFERLGGFFPHRTSFPMRNFGGGRGEVPPIFFFVTKNNLASQGFVYLG
jgi:hypothetical protein